MATLLSVLALLAVGGTVIVGFLVIMAWPSPPLPYCQMCGRPRGQPHQPDCPAP
jgi:hypothetical protein